MDYFASPLGFFSILGFLFLSGVLTVGLGDWLERERADLVPFFYIVAWLLPFLVSALSVRFWTGERADDTLEMIENLPLRTAQAVVGKWLAVWLASVLGLLCTLPFWGVVNVLGDADNLVIATSYLMAVLMCGGLASAGLLFAALGRNVRLGLGMSIGGLLLLNVIGWPTFLDALPSGFSRVLGYFSPYAHFQGAVQGVLNISDLIYFVSGTGLCLLATMAVISIRMPPRRAKRQERQQSVEGKRFQRTRVLKIAIIAVVALNVAAARTTGGMRLDVTEEGLHTLTPGTVRVLSQVKAPITVRLYYSTSLTDAKPGVREYYNEVRQKLENFRALSGGRVRTEYYNPRSGSESFIHAGAFGLRPVILAEGGLGSSGDEPPPIRYFGLVASNSNDALEVMPVIDLSRRRFIEHDLMRIVDALNNPGRKVVGLMSTLPVDPDTLKQAENAGSRTWAVIDLIRKLFTIRKIPLDVTEISSDIDVLMIIHPRELSTKTLYAIDQFTLNGGRVLAFVDPNAEVVRSLPGGGTSATSSDFNKLLEAWGVILDPYRVLGDLEAARPVRVGAADRKEAADYVADYVIWPSFTKRGFAMGSPVMGDLERINMGSPGILIPAEGRRTRVEPLIVSSEKSMRIGSRLVDVQPDPRALLRQFEPEGKRFIVAARITGKAMSAFKDGLPGVDPSHHLNTSVGSVNIIVVADTDMLFDSFWFFPDPEDQPRFAEPLKRGGRSVVVMADNSRFVVRALSHLSANEGVSTMEEAVARPRVFDAVRAIKDKYAPRPRGKERQLHGELKVLAERESTLSSRRMASGGPGLSREEAALLTQLPRKRESLRAELLDLPEVREREARISSEVGRLFAWVRFWTIFFMPLVLLVGAYGLVRRYRRPRH